MNMRKHRFAASAVHKPVESLESRLLFAGDAALRIDAAGGPTTDSVGNVWAQDAGFVGGSANTGTYAVAGTTDDALYSTRRTGTFSYANAVADGDYTLRLLFSDYYASAGQRKFNVSVEGQQVLTNFDIVAEAGSKTALVKSFPITISDGKLDMAFQSLVGYAAVSAFDLTPVDSEPPPPPPPPGDPATLSISDVSGNETNSGLTPFTFTVSRGGDASGTSTVNWATQNGSAGEGDYAVASGTLSFGPGQTSKTIVVNVRGDTKVEGDEIFYVKLSGAAGATIADTQGQGTIVNDDNSVSTNIADVTWTRNAPRSPLPRTEAGVVQIGSKIYAIGGFTSEGGTGSFFPLTRRVHVYDMADRTWSELASLPSQAAGNHFGVAASGNFIYVVAGQISDTYGAGTNTAWRYDIAGNTWEQFTSLPEIRYGGAAFVANGLLHFVGGDQADRTTPTADHWAIDLSDPTADWVRKTSIPRAGDHLSHATVNGKVYLIGGEHGHEGVGGTAGGEYIQHRDTYEYNPANDTWVRKADMPFGTSHVEGSTLVINNQIVLIGGLLDGGGSNTTNRVRVYNPANNTWKTLTTRYPKRIIGATAGYWNGKIYMTDGYSPDESDRSVGFEGTIKFA